MTGAALEWAAVEGGAVLVATPERAWLHRADGWGRPDPFALPMRHAPGDVAATGRLLEGAVAAGLAAARAAHPDRRPPPLTALRWMWRLAGLYHLTTHTPALMREAVTRFEIAGRPALAAWARDKARDETAHDALALRDLAAMGLDGRAVVDLLRPPVPMAMVAWFRDAVHAKAPPLGVLAYACAVERLAMRVDAGYLARVQALLPAGVDATRCLRVHSAVGSDARHVEENAAVVAALAADERAGIVFAVSEVARLSCAPSADGYVDDVRLAAVQHTTRQEGRPHE